MDKIELRFDRVLRLLPCDEFRRTFVIERGLYLGVSLILNESEYIFVVDRLLTRSLIVSDEDD